MTATDADSVSMEELQKIRTAVSLPIVVIGGINKGNTGRFKPMGIDGLAVVSAIIAQSDIRSLSWNGIQFLSHLTKQEKTADI